MTDIKLVAICCSLTERLETVIARDNDRNYYILTIHDARDVQVGDVLRGDFEAVLDCFRSVYCVSKKQEVKISLECAKIPLEWAVEEFLDKTGIPTEIFFMSGNRIITDVPDKNRQIIDEILRG